MPELLRQFDVLADRGTPRGADAVFAAVEEGLGATPPSDRPLPRYAALLVAAAVVVIGAAVMVLVEDSGPGTSLKVAAPGVATTAAPVHRTHDVVLPTMEGSAVPQGWRPVLHVPYGEAPERLGADGKSGPDGAVAITGDRWIVLDSHKQRLAEFTGSGRLIGETSLKGIAGGSGLQAPFELDDGTFVASGQSLVAIRGGMAPPIVAPNPTHPTWLTTDGKSIYGWDAPSPEHSSSEAGLRRLSVVPERRFPARFEIEPVDFMRARSGDRFNVRLVDGRSLIIEQPDASPPIVNQIELAAASGDQLLLGWSVASSKDGDLHFLLAGSTEAAEGDESRGVGAYIRLSRSGEVEGILPIPNVHQGLLGWFPYLQIRHETSGPIVVVNADDGLRAFELEIELPRPVITETGLPTGGRWEVEGGSRFLPAAVRYYEDGRLDAQLYLEDPAQAGEWRRIPLPKFAIPRTLHRFLVDAHFTDLRTGWVLSVACEGVGPESGARVHRTTDGGKSWRSAKAPGGSCNHGEDFTQLEVVDDRRLLIASAVPSGEFWNLWASDNGGGTWTERVHPRGGRVAFQSPTHGWTEGGYQSGLSSTSDGGSSWRPHALEQGELKGFANSFDVRFDSRNRGVMTVSYREGDSSTLAWFDLDPSGEWQLTASTAVGPSAGWRGAVRAEALDGTWWVVVNREEGPSLLRLDQRRAWRDLGPMALPGQVRSLVVTGADEAYASVASALYRTTDAGRTWRPVTGG